MGIAHGSKAHQYVNRMSFAVAQLHSGFLRLPLLLGSADWTACSTSDTTLAVTVQQNIVTTGASHYLMPLVSGNSLGALVPEQDLPVPVGHAYTTLQAVQYGPEDLWILMFRHWEVRRRCWSSHWQEKATLQAANGG